MTDPLFVGDFFVLPAGPANWTRTASGGAGLLADVAPSNLGSLLSGPGLTPPAFIFFPGEDGEFSLGITGPSSGQVVTTVVWWRPEAVLVPIALPPASTGAPPRSGFGIGGRPWAQLQTLSLTTGQGPPALLAAGGAYAFQTLASAVANGTYAYQVSGE